MTPGRRGRSVAGALLLPAALLVTTLFAGAAASGQSPPDATGRDPFYAARTQGAQALAAALNARERGLDRREATLLEKEKDLAVAEQRLMERMTELTELREQIAEMLEQADDERDARVLGLVKMIESMKARDAAPVVVALDDELAVEVLDRMSRAKAGKLLAEMKAGTAARLAEQMTRPVVLERES